ncbi:stimulator of interferon genes protein [Anoplophora glabripennis]|uniref:stimulator of interferon genes protein n=1 Tax=Anoplophora glabripennis TaxID=217634 RepID=UPI000874636C|nr:stimulator of interferon genes protein [Anoplophora glabripennis]XP_018576992.1 stimulator of interferon genes protein [Anoplophora glabripennis]
MASNERDVNNVNLKNVCVVQRGKKYYYPKSIPQERSSLSNYICLFISFGLFVVDILTNENKVATVFAMYLLGVLVSVSLQLLYRIVLVKEEFRHLTSRYGGCVSNLLKNAFYFPTKVWIALAFSVFYAVYYCCTNNVTELPFNFKNIAFLIPSIYFLTSQLSLETSSLNDSLWIAKDNGLDYGSGMAYSFFHGYLNLVLPKTGTEEKNLKELMEDYEAENRILFAAYKLFILIPKSLECFVSLKNEHSPSVDESQSLPVKEITVAGVQKRVYKNAVYKINTGRLDEKIYVSAEYATPLRTFLEVVKHTGRHTEYYDKHKNDIILQFYLTLKQILKRTGLDEFCELIYYEDYPQNTEANSTPYYDVGKIILTRIKELKKYQREKIE